MTHENGLIQILLSVKFCWHARMLIQSHISYDFFRVTTAELSSCNRDHMAHKD